MNILFVCTGNTCRSPMAQAFCEAEAEKRGIPLSCQSAGLWADPGEEMSPFAVEAVKEITGKDFSHCALQMTKALLEEADLVIPMTHSHRAMLENAFGKQDKIVMLSREIPDPYGYDRERYESTAELLAREIRQLFEGGLLHA